MGSSQENPPTEDGQLDCFALFFSPVVVFRKLLHGQLPDPSCATSPSCMLSAKQKGTHIYKP